MPISSEHANFNARARTCVAPKRRDPVIRIVINEVAYRAIRDTLDEASPLRWLEREESGKIFVWLERPTVDRLSAMRQPGEEISDFIVRLAAAA